MNILVEKAKQGDVDSQKFLLTNCKQITLNIAYQNLSFANHLGMNFQDLRELLIPAFTIALNTYTDDRIEFYEYVKYLYIIEIKKEFRYRKALKRSSFKQESLDSLEEQYNAQFQSPEFAEKSSKYSDYDIDLIREIILNKKYVKLTNKERELCVLFLQGCTVKEMSDKYQQNYSYIFKTLKNAFKKIKKFFDVNKIN